MPARADPASRTGRARARMTSAAATRLKKLEKRVEAKHVSFESILRTGDVDLEIRTILDERKPDLIVMDLCLPRLDGCSVVERLKTHPDTRQIPILALTGHGTDCEAGQRARRAGCDAFFTKPLAVERLVDTIREMVAFG